MLPPDNKSEHFQKEENRKVPSSRRRSELVKQKSQGQSEPVIIPFEGGGEHLFSNADQQRYTGSIGQNFRLDEGVRIMYSLKGDIKKFHGTIFSKYLIFYMSVSNSFPSLIFKQNS